MFINLKFFQKRAAVLFALLALFACKDYKERYEDPPWLGGSNIETLQAAGDYTIFLELMDRAGYTESVSKILYTLFVPNDEAFTEYFHSIGKESVDDLTDDEAFQLFTLHILVNPRSRYQLIYEYVWSEEQGPNGEYAGLFFRKRTPSRSTPYTEYVKYNTDFEGDSLRIYTGDKYVPLWSKDFFEDYFAATDGSDYTFIYPNSTYDAASPLANQAMNWHNARVIPNPAKPDELGARTSSGFIYYLDQVVAPMPSIEEYLRQHLDKYGVFYDLMQRFADYGLPIVDEDQNTFYQKSYVDLPNIANDAGPGDGPEVRMKDVYSAFIPEDNILEPYINNKLLASYGSIDSVPLITLSYVLRSHLIRSLGLVSKMERGFFNDFGDPLTLTRDDINSGYMCSNGVFYDMKKVLEPNAFTGVTGDLFFIKDYSTFLFALNETGMIRTLASGYQDVTLFAPTNDELEKSNVRYNKDANQIEYYGPDEVWRKMKTDQLTEFVQNLVTFNKVTDLSGEGFLEMSSGNYVHYRNNILQGPENQYLNDSITIVYSKEPNETGIQYGITNAIKSRYYSMGKLIWFDPELTEFAALLDGSRLLNRRIKDSDTKELIPRLSFVSNSDAWTVFAPTNDAIAAARDAGLIPEDRDSLIAFLEYHFVKDVVSFDNGDPSGSGTFSTQAEAPETPNGPKFYTVTINNEMNNLRVTDMSGQVVTVDHAKADNLAQKSVIHKINSVLKYQ
ncbi:fasciclin domain-containing protein [Saccharicrinis sp. FJH62]|uniref:fasciclin domain-containing protein n=1 Tax=Saccharicrinis sp. FJH62 TaxID=3344657 RepID=UPI0035D42EDF